MSFSGIALYLVSERSLVSDVDTRLSEEADDILQKPGNGLARIAARVVDHQSRPHNRDLSYLLADSSGHRIAGRLAMRFPKPGHSDVEYMDGAEGPDHGRALFTLLPSGSKLLIVADYGPLEDLNAHLLQVGSVALAAIILVSTLSGFALMRSVARRIEATTTIARSIMQGEMDHRMPYDGTGGAFDRQAAVFNLMLDRIQILMASLRQISAEVAHDMRTPLANLRNDVARLFVKGEWQDEDKITAILQQSESLISTFNTILRITEVEAGGRRANFATWNLCEIAEEIVMTFEVAIEHSTQNLSMGQYDETIVDGDREMISQALVNLIENSMKHGGAGANICVDVERRGGLARVTVSDNGPGIAFADRATALRRFGRLDASRSKPGNGLGLSLVDSVARLHGGNFLLEDANPGLASVIEIPCKRAGTVDNHNRPRKL